MEKLNNPASLHSSRNGDSRNAKKHGKIRLELDLDCMSCYIFGDKSNYGNVIGRNQSNINYIYNNFEVDVKVPLRREESNKIELYSRSRDFINLNHAITCVFGYLYNIYNRN